MKKVLGTRSAPARHWVGDGFPVHGLFGYTGSDVPERSPFLMLDYAAPTVFEPTTQRRGVGQHPHRGFETVTIVYAGEVEHRDSTGKGGVIGAGDVQWMTAGSGILHEEFHSTGYARSGGPFEMVQLWVNLPAAQKFAPPRYQDIRPDRLVLLTSADGGTLVRVIAGSFAWAMRSKTFRWEGFAGTQDTAHHLVGAVLMGVGGVTAMGCTVGQGLSGLSTLSLGSFIAVSGIVLGAVVTLHWQMRSAQ